jgi:hypothetical protein
MLWDEQDRQRHLRLLQAAGMAQANDEPLDVPELARELDVSEAGVRMDISQLYAMGLMLDGLEDGLPPILLTAGRQFLAGGGEVNGHVLSFLAHVIDDLHAREALLAAGTSVVDGFRTALLGGEAVVHARQLVPPAFAGAVDDRLALNLFAASVALVARLSDGAAAACVAEEIIAVGLIGEARLWLEMQREDGSLDEAAEDAASDELRGLFDLFEDDDVLQMFDMAEPADAAVARHDRINQQLGVADQRVERWFDAFGGAAPTGYLGERPPHRDE